MASLKHTFLKSTNSLIFLLVSILGFTTSCEDAPAEYGTPHADFIITGKVESVTDNQPIPDIIVAMRYVPKEENSSQSNLIGTGFSNGIGSYYLRTSGDVDDQTFQIKYTDTDGPLNGEYETLDTTVVFQDPKFTHGDGSWFIGYTEKMLDVKLKPKQ